MNWLDWLIVMVILFSTLQGLRRGLLVGLAKITGLLAALFVAYTYYRPVANLMSERWQLENLVLSLVEPFLKYWQPAAEMVSPFAASEYLTGNYLPRLVSYSILEALTFLGLLLITVWLVNAAGVFLTKIADVSFLGPLNHLGGLLFGFIKGVLLVVVIFTVVNLLPGGHPFTPGTSFPTGNALANSVLLPYFKPLISIIEPFLPGIIPRYNIMPEQSI